MSRAGKLGNWSEDAADSQLVRESYLFRSLDDVGRRRLIERGLPRKYRSGMIVVREGEQGDDFFIVKSGSVRVLTGKSTRCSSSIRKCVVC